MDYDNNSIIICSNEIRFNDVTMWKMFFRQFVCLEFWNHKFLSFKNRGNLEHYDFRILER